MSEKDVQDHLTLVHQTGRKRLSDEQREIIRKLDGDALSFEDEDEGNATLDLQR